MKEALGNQARISRERNERVDVSQAEVMNELSQLALNCYLLITKMSLSGFKPLSCFR
jgi:hypothetical protein